MIRQCSVINPLLWWRFRDIDLLSIRQNIYCREIESEEGSLQPIVNRTYTSSTNIVQQIYKQKDTATPVTPDKQGDKL